MATFSLGRDDAAPQIRAMDEEFVRNANAGNAEALVESFYADDAQLLPPRLPGTWPTGGTVRVQHGRLQARG